VSALIGVMAEATDLVYSLFPALKPDPAERQVASASIVKVDRGVALGEYTSRIERERPADLDACLPGDVYYIRQSLEGFKSRSTRIEFYTYRVGRGRLQRAFPTVSGVDPRLEVRPSRTTDLSIVQAWVQWPYRSGRFFIRFEIYREKGLLSLVDSKPFVISQRKYGRFFQECNGGDPPRGA